jgi:putative phosphoribosyl transferase
MWLAGVMRSKKRHLFSNRAAAGQALARSLEHLRGRDCVILALPRGGVPVAHEVAAHLGVPLDVIVVRKLGLPWQPELAFGAIGEGGVRVVDERVVARSGLSPEELTEVEGRERDELARRILLYRGERPAVPLDGRVAVVVDDGIATGSTMRAAAAIARARGASSVIVAVPVAPSDIGSRLLGVADEVVVVEAPRGFQAIGSFYENFSQTTDEEVRRLLEP